MDFRETRSQMRTDVHDVMGIAALYIASPGATPVPCRVRLHEKNATHGGLQGTNFHYSEREEMDVKIRFKLSEVPEPKRDAVVSIAQGEAYTIDRREANDLDFVYCPALRMRVEDTTGLPVPEA